MKKFLIILVSVAVLGYLIFAAVSSQKTMKDTVCSGFEVVIKDSVDSEFIKPEDVIQFVKKKGLYPVGKPFGEINTLAIRDSILINKLVRKADVYTTPGGAIVTNIYQRKPVLRVISITKGSYYIDNNREKMPVSQNSTIYIPLATGAITDEFAQNELYDFAMFLNDNPDWDAWIEQIVVKGDQKVELIPRVGDFRIVIGELENYNEKLNKFKLFVEKGLNVVGWNRYNTINLEYDGQVVCTKK